MSALAKERADVKRTEAGYLVDLYNAGLIDKNTAAEKAAKLL